MGIGRPSRNAVLIAATLGASFVLPALPPAAGVDQPPETVLRHAALGVPSPLDPRATVARGAGWALAASATWTRPAVACAEIAFTSVALSWRQGGPTPVPVLLAWGDGERFGPTFRARSDPDHAPDPGTAPPVRVGTPPVWTGEARCVRYSLELPAGEEVRGLRASFINTSGTAHGRSLLATLSDGFTRAWRLWAGAPARAAAPQPAIVTRAQWGADESLRTCGPDYADRLRMAYVHHTATGNGYARSQADDVVRSIYAYHTQSRGFCDIAYNFLVDRFGTVYEGRAGGVAEPVIGGHAMGFNSGSTGLAVIGDFQTAEPTAASVRAATRLLAWRLDVAHLEPTGTATMVSAGGSNQRFAKGEEVQLPVISGHRETGFTSCPGDRLWSRLERIRTVALKRGVPKIWDAASSTEAIEIGRSAASLSARLSAALDWSVVAAGADGAAVRTWTSTGTEVAATWNGLDHAGYPVAPGDYTLTIAAQGPDGAAALPATFAIQVAGGCDVATGPGGGLLTGDEGPNVLCGGDGDDELRGMGGDDVLIGLGGDDVLIGGEGGDLLLGGLGNDSLQGEAGFDTLQGLEGDDVLDGGPGADLLEGGAGDDDLKGGPGEGDTAGFAGSFSPVTADLEAGTVTGEGSDTLANIVHLIGSAGPDVLAGDASDNTLTGGGGDDLLVGRDGNDTLVGGQGADRLVGGAGDDVLLGQKGLDVADHSAAPGAVAVDLLAGTATGEGADTLSGIRGVIGSPFDDVLAGDGKGNRLVGGDGADALAGRAGDDTLIGGRHADVLRGGPGSDALRGGPDDDDLRGGGGDDRLHGGRGRDRLHGGGGSDELRARDRTRDDVAGGGGRDRASVDRVDRVRGVEQLR